MVISGKTHNVELKLFLSLLREALWRNSGNIPSELTEEESKRLFPLAEKQAVLGLIIDSLMRHNVKIPQMKVFEAIGTLEQIKNANRHVNEGVVDLHQLMEKYGVNYAVIKGQAVATCYPEPLLRQSGDIDYYSNSGFYECSMQAVKEMWKITPEIHGSEKHADYDFKGNRYEAHFLLTDLHNKSRNDYLLSVIDSDQISTVTINGEKVRTFSPTLHSFYIFLHIYFHLIELGVGLRQFCDWAMILHSSKDEIDHEAIKRHLKALGMEKAYKACGAILVRDLRLPSDEFTYELTDKDMRFTDRILNVVFYRGNMGHYNKKGGFHGWRHKLESSVIKLSHFVKFYPLAPSFMRDWGWSVIKSRL